MTYLAPRTRSGSRLTRVALMLAGVIVVAVVLVEVFRPSFFPAIASSVARPFWRTEFSMLNGSLMSPQAILNENAGLKRQIESMQAEMASVRATEDENAQLKALMGRASTTPYTLAAVLRRPPLAPYDELIVDAGADHGFAPGNLVYAPGNVLVGRIAAVEGQTSTVVLLSSPGQTYPVQIGPQNAAATATGRGGGQYESSLPRDIKVSQGDVVASAALSDKAFGIVTAVVTDPTQPFETVLFAPPVNIFQLRFVLVDTHSAE